MWYGHLARHRQDACATSFTSEMETLYIDIDDRPNASPLLVYLTRDRVASAQPNRDLYSPYE